MGMSRGSTPDKHPFSRLGGITTTSIMDGVIWTHEEIMAVPEAVREAPYEALPYRNVTDEVAHELALEALARGQSPQEALHWLCELASALDRWFTIQARGKVVDPVLIGNKRGDSVTFAAVSIIICPTDRKITFSQFGRKWDEDDAKNIVSLIHSTFTLLDPMKGLRRS